MSLPLEIYHRLKYMFYVKKIDDLSLLFGQKGGLLCKKFFSVSKRFPFLLSSSDLKDLAFFLANVSKFLVESRSFFILRKILFNLFRSSRKEAQVQSIWLKILDIQPSIFGIFFSSQQKVEGIFCEEQILKGVQWLIPAIKSIPKSYFTCKRANRHFFYLEVIKLRGGVFSTDEKEKLVKELPKVFKKDLEPKALFFPGNDEELFKKTQLLGKELKNTKDLPQVLITCLEYFDKRFNFLVIVVRFHKPRTASILKLSQKLSLSIRFNLENLFCLQKLDSKHVKEAAVFSMEVVHAPFLRNKNAPDLRTARKYVVKELENMIGPFRDYNGASSAKKMNNL